MVKDTLIKERREILQHLIKLQDNLRINFSFFNWLKSFKNDYVIEHTLKCYNSIKEIDKFPYNGEHKLFYVFVKDTLIIKIFKDLNEETEPIQVYDLKDTSLDGLLLDLIKNVDIKKTMEEIDIQLGE